MAPASPFKLRSIACDPDLIEDGVDVEVYPGWKWRVRNIRARAYQRWLQKHDTEVERTPNQMREWQAEAMSQAGVIDWSPVEDEAGREMLCTPENVKRVLLDPKFPDAIARCASAMTSLDNFRQREVDAAKNG